MIHHQNAVTMGPNKCTYAKHLPPVNIQNDKPSGGMPLISTMARPMASALQMVTPNY
jgi:hypothetical protein